MKIESIFEQDVLRADTTAQKIAQQLVRTAKRNAPADGYGAEVLAKKLAARYYKNILDEIDLELKMQQAQRI